MLGKLIIFLEGLFSVFLKHKENTAVSLGKSEERADIEQDDVEALNREAIADANLPQNKTAMEELLAKGKLAVPFIVILLASCCEDQGTAYPCQQVRQWGIVEQQNMLADFRNLPPDSPLIGAFIDYFRMRQEARACPAE
jgi:hypothetical protein